MASKNKAAKDACQEFIDRLIGAEALEHKGLFEIMDNVAVKSGYTLEAHQRGIHGTEIFFRKLPKGERTGYTY